MCHSDNIQTLVSHPSSRSRFAYSRKTSSCSNYNNLTIIPCKPTERGNTLTIHPVHFGLLNARSVNKKTLIVKDFQVVVEHCIDLQAVTETWLQSGIDTSMAIPVGKCVIFFCFYIYLFIYLFSSLSVKVLPVTPLLSGVFVHRVFCAYFVRFKGLGVMRRFLRCTQENI